MTLEKTLEQLEDELAGVERQLSNEFAKGYEGNPFIQSDLQQEADSLQSQINDLKETL